MNLIIEKMKIDGLPEQVIQTFLYYYQLLRDGKTGYINENDIDSVSGNEIPDYSSLENGVDKAPDELKQTVIIKLNGGLGTTMGLEGAKSLIPVKNDLTFLDIAALQAITLSKKYDLKIPLLLMNSFRTEKQSSKLLEKYHELNTSLPHSFLQHKFPKILAADFTPAKFQENPDLEWNPPGHGDLYTALVTSGTLDTLLSSGYKYAFVSNSDNLGASLDIKILNFLVSSKLSFLMEVTDRTWMDRKGGHLARLRKNGHLVLRESSQCPPEDVEHFRNIERHAFFNTNNLWINLEALHQLIDTQKGQLELPMIRNRKRLNPVDNSTPEVFQIETAMGAAISIFENAQAIRVPRTRFAPVKNCEELLLLWSDLFLLDDQYHIIPNQRGNNARISINLDPRYYSWLNQLREHFPHGTPSLCKCDSLTVKGDVVFGKNISMAGTVTITNDTGIRQFLNDNMSIDTPYTF